MRRIHALALAALLATPLHGGTIITVVSGGGGTPVTQIFQTRNDNLTASTTDYCLVHGGSYGCTTTEGAHQIPFAAGTISELRVNLTSNAGGSGITFNVRKNGSATGQLSCNVASGASTCSDTSTSLSFSAGDLVALERVATASITASVAYVSFKWVGSNSNESMLFLHYQPNDGTTTRNLPPVGGTSIFVGAAAQQLLLPVDMTAVALYARHGAGLSGGSRVITIRKDGVNDTALQATITSGATVSDTTGTVSFTGGTHRVSIQDAPSSPTPTTGDVFATLVLTNTAQKFVGGHCVSESPSNSANRYSAPNDNHGFQTTETTLSYYTDAMTVTNIAVRADAGPSSGSLTFSARNNTADAFTGCALSGSATSCTASGTGSFADNDRFNYAIVPASTPSPLFNDVCFAYAATGL